MNDRLDKTAPDPTVGKSPAEAEQFILGMEFYQVVVLLTVGEPFVQNVQVKNIPPVRAFAEHMNRNFAFVPTEDKDVMRLEVK